MAGGERSTTRGRRGGILEGGKAKGNGEGGARRTCSSAPFAFHPSPFALTSPCRDVLLVQRHRDPGARGQYDVSVLRLDRPLRSHRAADDTPDDGALGAATEHSAHHRAHSRPGTDLGSVRPVDSTADQLGVYARDRG